MLFISVQSCTLVWMINLKFRFSLDLLTLIDFLFPFSHFVPQYNIHFWRWWTKTMTPIGMLPTMLETVSESPILIFISLELQVILNQIDALFLQLTKKTTDCNLI